jgi:TfoX/Sxy family transcriptional regulator of competence genes
MAYNEKLADNVRALIALKETNVKEKRMFGGLCFMVKDKMCIGVEKDRLMLRIDPEIYETLLEKEGCAPMDFNGKPMKGFVFVEIEVLQLKRQLTYWVNLALAYNPCAKLSKKKIKNK